MGIGISPRIMEESTFSWSSIGGNAPHLQAMQQVLDTIPVLMRDNKLEVQGNIANLRMEMMSAIRDIHETIGDLKAEVRTMNNNFLLDTRKVLSSDYDEKAISTFMSLDELNIEPQERPIDDDSPVVTEEVIIVEEGFTAPPPEKPLTELSFEGMTDEDIVVHIVSGIEEYLAESPVLMNSSLQKKGIVPLDYKKSKGVSKLLNASVLLEDSPIRKHKLDRMREIYYLDGVENPQKLYDETFA